MGYDSSGYGWSGGTGSGGGVPSGAAGGDLSGLYPNPEVIAFHSGTSRITIGDFVEGEFVLFIGGQMRTTPAGVWIEDVFVATTGQTIFTLSRAPIDAKSFAFSVNGVVYAEGVDFTLVGDIVTWLEEAFVITAGDEAIAKYIDAFSISLGSVEVGVPSDGTFEDGLLPITPTTTVVDAIDQINEALAVLAPPAPGGLAGQSLVFSGATMYSAKLPYGLSSAWQPYTPGDTIANLIFASAYALSSPSPATRFHDGFYTIEPIGHRVAHILDGVEGDSRAVTDGVGTTGTVQITAIDLYSGIWRKINARLNCTHNGEGRKTHAMKSSEAGVSVTSIINRDDDNPTPVFLVAPSFVVAIPAYRYLSGIQYYAEGARFDISFTAGSGIFRKHYHATQVASIAMPGVTTHAVNPSSVPNIDDTFAVSAHQMLLVSGSTASFTASITVTIRKASGSQAQQILPLAYGINTYASGGSTTTKDIFVDELKRVVPGTVLPWNSSAALLEGNAQVRNGSLVHGYNGSYPAHSSSSNADWERASVAVGVQSGGTVRFSGISASQVAKYGTGAVNVFLKLDGDNKWFDLGLDSPFVNGTGDGSSVANSIGARFSFSGGDLIFTLAAPAAGGPYSTGGSNGGKYRLMIRFRGATGLSITSVEGL